METGELNYDDDINEGFEAESYEIDLGFDTLKISANFADASCTIYYEADGEWHSSPFQVADSRHDVETAAIMLIEWFGLDYYFDPADEDEIAEIDHVEYIRDLIRSVN